MKRLIIACLLMSCIGSATSSDQGAKKPSWNAKMAEIATTLTALIPYLFDDKKFQDPQNSQQILQLAKKLRDLAHSIDQTKMGSPDHVVAEGADPAITLISHAFKDELERGYESLSSGNWEYGRRSYQTSVSYCISCHTRSNIGPQFPITNFDTQFKSLPPVQRMMLLAATRQFDASLVEYSSNSAKPMDPFDLERATRVAMAVSIRVKNDPDHALMLLHLASQKQGAIGMFKEDLTSWRKSLVAWKEEAPARSNSESDLLKQANDLIHKAKLQQMYPMDAKGDIYYLRATSILHRLLKEYPNSSHIAEILYLNGLCYETLRDLGFWSLHEMYYEACVVNAPHSDIGQKCFKHLKDNITEGYTGSRGTNIPAKVVEKMETLEVLARPSPNAPSP